MGTSTGLGDFFEPRDLLRSSSESSLLNADLASEDGLAVCVVAERAVTLPPLEVDGSGPLGSLANIIFHLPCCWSGATDALAAGGTDAAAGASTFLPPSLP